MAKSFSVTHILDLNILHLFNTTLFLSIILILFCSFKIYSAYALPIELTDTDSYLPFDDQFRIINLMVTHCDCENNITFASLNH